jgi:mono/diheme cytochrome c family protein
MTSFRTMLIATAALLGTLAATAVIAEGPDLPEAPGKMQIMESCTQCHGVDVIVAQPRSSDEWSQVVGRMVGNGAALTDEQYQAVLAYLSTNLAPPADPPASGAAPAPSAH